MSTTLGLMWDLCGGPAEPFERGIHRQCMLTENIRAEMTPDILSTKGHAEAEFMTRARNGTYIWATWLSKLMAGEVGCHWAAWFKAHHTEYPKAPSDFQLAVWTAEHTQLLDEVAKERSALGESVYKENQNYFLLRHAPGHALAGKPDLVVIDHTGRVTVYEVKTGKARQSDIIQMMVYMMCLPYASPLYKGKSLQGCVVYKSGERSPVPPEAIDDAFRKNTRYFIDLLVSSAPPARSPSHAECLHCDITNADCPDRIDEGFIADLEAADPEIPF